MTNQRAAFARQSFYNDILAISQPHLRPLISAARDGGIILAMIDQNAGPAPIPNRSKPVITIYCDDPGSSLGPVAFDKVGLANFACRAMLTIVNAWALEPELYLYALAAATGQLWSVMFVETRLRHEQAWIAAIKGANPDMTFLVASAHQTPGL